MLKRIMIGLAHLVLFEVSEQLLQPPDVRVMFDCSSEYRLSNVNPVSRCVNG